MLVALAEAAALVAAGTLWVLGFVVASDFASPDAGGSIAAIMACELTAASSRRREQWPPASPSPPGTAGPKFVKNFQAKTYQHARRRSRLSLTCGVSARSRRRSWAFSRVRRSRPLIMRVG